MNKIYLYFIIIIFIFAKLASASDIAPPPPPLLLIPNKQKTENIAPPPPPVINQETVVIPEMPAVIPQLPENENYPILEPQKTYPVDNNQQDINIPAVIPQLPENKIIDDILEPKSNDIIEPVALPQQDIQQEKPEEKVVIPEIKLPEVQSQENITKQILDEPLVSSIDVPILENKEVKTPEIENNAIDLEEQEKKSLEEEKKKAQQEEQKRIEAVEKARLEFLQKSAQEKIVKEEIKVKTIAKKENIEKKEEKLVKLTNIDSNKNNDKIFHLNYKIQKLPDILISASDESDNSHIPAPITDISIRQDLFQAVMAGKIDHIRAVENYNGNLNLSDENGNNILIYAVVYNQKQVVKWLIMKGFDVNATNKYHSSALHFAAYKRHYEIIDLLVNHKSNIYIRNDDGKLAQDYLPFDEIIVSNEPKPLWYE
jgi:hypothetical protein